MDHQYEKHTVNLLSLSFWSSCVQLDNLVHAPVILLQVWATYSPVKNSPADARVKAAEGNPTHSATTGEMDIYKCNAHILEQLAGKTGGMVSCMMDNKLGTIQNHYCHLQVLLLVLLWMRCTMAYL